jgi:predicted RNA-binding protein with RPS1 domain
MEYPTIESDLLIHTDRKEFKLYTDKVLIENLKTMDTSVEVSVEVVSSDNVNEMKLSIRNKQSRKKDIQEYYHRKYSVLSRTTKR